MKLSGKKLRELLNWLEIIENVGVYSNKGELDVNINISSSHRALKASENDRPQVITT